MSLEQAITRSTEAPATGMVTLLSVDGECEEFVGAYVIPVGEPVEKTAANLCRLIIMCRLDWSKVHLMGSSVDAGLDSVA